MGVVRGVSMLKAAKIELIQETGYRARRWRKLGVYDVAPGWIEARRFSDGPSLVAWLFLRF